MSELIAAKVKGDLLERYEEEREALDEDATESELVRDLLERGVDARQLPLYTRVGFSDRLASQLENERPTGVDEDEILREVAEDGLRARRGDALDAIGAGDELRDAVGEHREEGEPLDDALRRLLRVGVAATTPPRRTRRDRLITGLGGAGVAAVPIAFVALGLAVGGVLGGVLAAVFAIALSVLAFAFGDLVGDAVGQFQAWAADVLEEEAERNRSR